LPENLHHLVNLTALGTFITLRTPMSYRFRFLSLLAVACIAFPARSPAPVVFRPHEKVKYVNPGEEEISGNAQELFNVAQSAERDGKAGRALKAYRKIVAKYPRSSLAPGAQFQVARLLEDRGDYLKAADAYRELVERFPRSPQFEEAIEKQFQIGDMYMQGKKLKVLGLAIFSSLDRSVEIFAAIIRTAPYGKYTARAQFNIGRAREKQGQNDLAIAAYEAVVEKFPNDSLAVDAQYQIGYLWFTAARQGTYDQNAALQARTGFQDFLFKFPKSEKAPQAKENLRLLEQKQTNNSLDIAKFYDKQKNYRAAVIYYNEVIRQQPGSTASEVAKRRVDELRSKVGDAALQPAAAIAAAKPKKNMEGNQQPDYNAQSASGKPARANAADLAPLPPAEADSALPPPASLSPEPSATPENSASPEPSAAPSP
jgi:outer membrane protein assembly factor BamD